MKKLVFIYLLMGFSLGLKAQHEEEHEEFKHHRVALFMGNSHIPAGDPAIGRTGTIIVPTWGLDYEFWFNHQLALGWYSDIEIQSYVINSDNHQDLEREYPIITSVVLVYVPWKTLSIYVGPGLEIERNESFFVTKIGVEYGIELPNHWDLAPGISYDNKEGEFDAWSFGFSIGKKF